MRWLVAALWVVVATAGCLDGGTQEAQDGPTGQIDGAVLNHILIPYANATVWIPQLDRATTTTDLGGFTFYDVPVGFHTLEVSLPDGSDREVVAVQADKVTRLILQIFPEQTVPPHITALSKTNVVDLAMPGEACQECRWQTSLDQRHPDFIELIVAWDGRHPAMALAETHLVVELRDEDGHLLAGPLGRQHVIRGDDFRLCAIVQQDQVPATAGSLRLEFRFDEQNPLPHPDFEFESHLRLHYADDELAC